MKALFTVLFLLLCFFQGHAQSLIFKKSNAAVSSKKFFHSLTIDKRQFKNLRLVHDSLSGDDFWMDAQEVTNEEYRNFTTYCRDSSTRILRNCVHSNIDGQESIDWKKKMSWKGGNFAESILSLLDINTYGKDNFVDVRLSVLASKIEYGKWPDSNNIVAVYPDTTCWVKETGDSLSTKNYFSSSSFNHYPVVGVSYWQALAYFRWLQEMWNSALQKAGNTTHYFEVRPPNKNEWSAALKIESPQSQDMVYTLPAHIKGKKAIYNLSGNVAEWLYDSTDLQNNASNAKKITQSSLVKEIAENELPATTQRSYVGFRYVVRLKAKEVALEQVNR